MNYKKLSLEEDTHNTQSILSYKQFTNQSDWKPLNLDNDLWRAENGVFVFIK